MLYLNNSKGKDAKGLVEDIFQQEFANRSRVLNLILPILRQESSQRVHCMSNGEIYLELLLAAEGIEFTLETPKPEKSMELLKRYQVEGLVLNQTKHQPDLVFCSKIEQVDEMLDSSTLPQTILVLDPFYNRTSCMKLRKALISVNLIVKNACYFSFFTRVTSNGRIGRFLGRLDQSILQYIVPNRLKRGIFLHLTHG